MIPKFTANHNQLLPKVKNKPAHTDAQEPSKHLWPEHNFLGVLVQRGALLARSLLVLLALRCVAVRLGKETFRHQDNERARRGATQDRDIRPQTRLRVQLIAQCAEEPDVH